jgi:hypothetical protein
MTRTYVDATSMSGGPSRWRASLRMLLILPVVLLFLAAPAAPALAAGATNSEGLSGYKHAETGKKETQPSKEAQSPKGKEAAHEQPTSASAPATSAVPAKKASTLPFTGFDLRWTVGFGLLLMGAGTSIVVAQRRQRRRTGDR